MHRTGDSTGERRPKDEVFIEERIKWREQSGKKGSRTEALIGGADRGNSQ